MSATEPSGPVAGVAPAAVVTAPGAGVGGPRSIGGRVAATALDWRADVLAALPGWVAARLGLVIAYLAARVLARGEAVEPVALSQGLFAWDGAWYRTIAEAGYAADAASTRFHPLLPMLGGSGPGILVVANLGALAAGVVVHRLVVATQGDADLARRSATLVALAPAAFVLSWAYAEGPFLAFAAAHLLALHRRSWWWAAAFAALATLARPTGLLLAVAALVAVLVARPWQGPPLARRLAGPAAAVAAAPLALVGWLLWVEAAFGDGALPLRVQEGLRDGSPLPPVRLVRAFGEVFTDPLGDGLHLPFALAALALVVVAWRRLPLAWAALALATVLTCLSAGNLNSTERYAYACPPLLVALAAVTGGRWWRPALAVSALGFVALATLAWYGEYVP